MSAAGGEARVGVVLIGRNEGERLVRALESVCGQGHPVVYVDSGSSDGSCDAALQRGARVVELDMSVPFSAGRARNAGWRALLGEDVAFVQFIDGDCEVIGGWIDTARAYLGSHDDVVAVTGYRRERFPERTVFNRICDVEWRSGPVGDVTNFGGDVMIRLSTLKQVDGYDPSVIAAEDDEIGIRLRRHGRLVRLDEAMTLHDADMHTVAQWWQRAKRCGHGYAQVNKLHGAPPEHYFRDHLKRSLLWGAVAPAGALALSLPTLGLSMAVGARYPISAARAAMDVRRRGFSWSDAIAWGVSCAAAPLPEALGAVKFYTDQLLDRSPEIIEYKGAKAPTVQPSKEDS